MKKILYKIYYFTIGWIINLIIKVYKRIAKLGLALATLTIMLAALIFYSPAIVAVIFNHWEIATAYIAFWMLPVSPGIITFIGLTVGIASIIEKIISNKSKEN